MKVELRRLSVKGSVSGESKDADACDYKVITANSYSATHGTASSCSATNNTNTCCSATNGTASSCPATNEYTAEYEQTAARISEVDVHPYSSHVSKCSFTFFIMFYHHRARIC